MSNEFYRRPDQIKQPLSIKAEVQNAVKEAMVETMKKTKLEVAIMTEAAIRVQAAFNQYARSSLRDDEMGNLCELAALKFAEVLDEKGVVRPDIIATFTDALEEHLPPFPGRIPHQDYQGVLKNIPPEEAPRTDVE